MSAPRLDVLFTGLLHRLSAHRGSCGAFSRENPRVAEIAAGNARSTVVVSRATKATAAFFATQACGSGFEIPKR
ncbi:hypothetical protein [Mesorhizobium sp.]|uniref:hypothetical protein n=1 Tax=Mesorhizobium sp. TaxID=1871066 RepID=UPI0011FDBFF3|nr:hypothetical protein [Mesorhizobium sp.]TIP85278.1 MAG: hypothetical protein E5X60_30700 [Mesorhizobium sp.]